MRTNVRFKRSPFIAVLALGSALILTGAVAMAQEQDQEQTEEQTEEQEQDRTPSKTPTVSERGKGLDGGRSVYPGLVLTGKLRATDAEYLAAPATQTWQISLQWLIEEGSIVSPGDPIARFDPGSTQSELLNKEDELDQKRQERQSQKAQARLRAMELELAFKRAEVAFKKAQIDASIPQDLLDGKSYRDRQLSLRRTRQALDDAQGDVLEQEASTRSTLANLAIEIREIEAELVELGEELEALTLRSTRNGMVLHEIHRWFGRKVRIGDRLQATMPVASIPDVEALEVEAWAGGTDAARLETGQPVRIVLDAYPDRSFSGNVATVASAGERRESWGRASYQRVTVAIDGIDSNWMKPGMSVRCEIVPDVAVAGGAE